MESDCRHLGFDENTPESDAPGLLDQGWHRTGTESPAPEGAKHNQATDMPILAHPPGVHSLSVARYWHLKRIWVLVVEIGCFVDPALICEDVVPNAPEHWSEPLRTRVICNLLFLLSPVLLAHCRPDCLAHHSPGKSLWRVVSV